MNWDRNITQLELRALCDFVLNEKNHCTVVTEKEYPKFMNEGLRQTLYKYAPSNEYVFIVRQKGYIMNAVHLKEDEIEEFLDYWKNGLLTPYGRINPAKERKAK